MVSSTRIAEITFATHKDAALLLSCLSSMLKLTLSNKGPNPTRIKIFQITITDSKKYHKADDIKKAIRVLFTKSSSLLPPRDCSLECFN
jgi:hypothetical protein